MQTHSRNHAVSTLWVLKYCGERYIGCLLALEYSEGLASGHLRWTLTLRQLLRRICCPCTQQTPANELTTKSIIHLSPPDNHFPQHVSLRSGLVLRVRDLRSFLSLPCIF